MFFFLKVDKVCVLGGGRNGKHRSAAFFFSLFFSFLSLFLFIYFFYLYRIILLFLCAITETYNETSNSP